MSDSNGAMLPIYLGQPLTVQFCPNPSCRRPFYSRATLAEAMQHFDANTQCGRWLSSIASGKDHDIHPNPTCQQPFDGQDDVIFHLTHSASPCSTSFQQIWNNSYQVNEDVESEGVDHELGAFFISAHLFLS
jgi:hypothetical protein